MLLKTGDVARYLSVDTYTLKRWYKWYLTLTAEQIEDLKKEGMPELPKYEVAGKRKDRVWKDEDLEDLKSFCNWVPKGKFGKMGGV